MMGGSMSERRGAANWVAAVLAADGLAHLYWTTGSTWPAANTRSLSEAVLGADVPFTPPILLPLATILLGAAGLVLARSRWGRRWPLQAGTIAIAVGVSVRALAGVVWALGIGTEFGGTFYWLNLIVYTPLCIGMAVAALRVAGVRRVGVARESSTV
jgi:uncharacterized protein DUF3995